MKLPGYDNWKTDTPPDTPIVPCMFCGELTEETDTCIECQETLSEAKSAAKNLLHALNASVSKSEKVTEDLDTLQDYQENIVNSLRSELSEALSLFEIMEKKLEKIAGDYPF